jgi:hypothetical protein
MTAFKKKNARRRSIRGKSYRRHGRLCMILPPNRRLSKVHEKGDRGRFTLTIRELPWLLVQQEVFLLQRKKGRDSGLGTNGAPGTLSEYSDSKPSAAQSRRGRPLVVTTGRKN